MANVLITGANRGIGLELVKLYAARGDTVLACCRNARNAEALNAVPGSVEVLEVQVSDSDSVAGLARELEGRPVDILINNAGTMGPPREQQSVQSMDYEGWAEAFEVNTMAPVRVMQALMPNLKASSEPRVATVTSQMGALSLDMPVAYAYCSSKAALNKFMKMAAIELGRDGINVCVIHPGWVQTDMGGPNADLTPEESAEGIVRTIDGLNADTNGSFWKWNGEEHAW
jgi:NAD(P)-dependent dehydrogenase (short-subunit alcohol dehydrogenase family)